MFYGAERIIMAARNYIELVEKTLRVLESLSESEPGIALGELAARVGLVKSSLFRILFTLNKLGYVEKVGTEGVYASTHRLQALARKPIRRPNFIGIAHPRLQEMCAKLRESAWLAEWHNGAVIMIDVAESSSHALQLALNVGDPCPLHASALGKVIAAHLSRAELESVLGKGRLARYTERSISSRKVLLAQLAAIRRDGYGLNDEETIRGALAIGAPVFDSTGRAFAAVSVTAPTARCFPAKKREMIAETIRAASVISEDLAHAEFVANFRMTETETEKTYGS
jgi:IclR family acetate operon transcriptional repressor